MANRRANKKVRALVRARMNETGESYQRALAALSHVSRGALAAPAPRRSSLLERFRLTERPALFGYAAALFGVADAARALDEPDSELLLRSEAAAVLAVALRG